MAKTAEQFYIKHFKEENKMAINKVDYEVLTTGVSVYANQADAIDDALNALIQMNEQLQDGWTNQTADAFIQRFEEEYRLALENVRDAIQGISDYIQNYMQAKQDDDTAGAAAIRS